MNRNKDFLFTWVINVLAIKVFMYIQKEHLCQSRFIKKIAGLSLQLYFKKRLWHMCFLMNFAKFIRTPFLPEHLRWLFMYILN